jgi:uncharacterized membrane protein (DUF373 family)
MPLPARADEAKPGMDTDPQDSSRIVRISTALFAQIEHFVYIALGALLSVGAVIALCEAGVTLWHKMVDSNATGGIFIIVDRLLFVLLLVEILHTIRASIRTGGLAPEPFLIVGLIASIRRVLVITLRTSEATKQGTMDAGDSTIIRESLLELSVLGGLILILVVSLYLLSRRGRTEPGY